MAAGLRDEESQSVEEHNNDQLLRTGTIIAGRFEVRNRIGRGSFGQVFLAFDQKENREVAIKVEKPPGSGKRSFLDAEIDFFELLSSHKLTHVPELIASNSAKAQRYLVMQLMSFSLTELRHKCPKTPQRFSLGTALRLSMQCFTAVVELHYLGLLHRDIKPSNFMVGASDSTRRRVYIIDYGLARYFRNASGGITAPRNRPGFVGTIRYASRHAHDGAELGPRDDFISLLYSMIEMRSGHLPWRKMEEAAVGEMKRSITVQALCSGMPTAIIQFAGIVSQLSYQDLPPYEHLRQLLESVIQDHRIRDEHLLDWENMFADLQREIADADRPQGQ